MSRQFLWIAFVAGIVALVGAFWWLSGKSTTPLNASGYTYPSSAGA